MATVRKNQARLSKDEWQALIAAIDAARKRNAKKPTYQDFVGVHVEAMVGAGMHTWGVHSMAGMRGRNFLAWHRWYLLQFERRLQDEDPDIAIPYWTGSPTRGFPPSSIEAPSFGAGGSTAAGTRPFFRSVRT